PGGIFTVSRWVSSTSPVPEHSGQGFAARPVPAQVGQVVLKGRGLRLRVRPVPLQVGHLSGFPWSPVPLQVGQRPGRVSASVPSASWTASGGEIGTLAVRSPPRAGAARAPAPPAVADAVAPPPNGSKPTPPMPRKICSKMLFTSALPPKSNPPP